MSDTAAPKAPNARDTPVVLLHGFTGSPRGGDAAIAAAPAGLACWAPALPGHASGPPCADGFSKNLKKIAAAISDRGMRGCHLIGYSLGARVALGLLIEHPAIASGATLIGAHFGLDNDIERRERRERDRVWVHLLRERGVAAFVDRWAALPLFESQQRCPSERLESQRRARLSHDPEGLARSLETMGLAEMPSYWDRLAAIETDVELVTGSLDHKFFALAARATSHNVRLRHRVIDGAGHNVALEAPEAIWRSV